MEDTSGRRLTPVDALLADAGSAHARAQSLSRSIRAGETDLFLYGAGTIGREVLARLRAGGIEPRAFADDTQQKRGTSIDGLPVLSPVEAAQQSRPGACIAVTMFNAALPYQEAKRRLEAIGGFTISSVFGLALAFPELLLPVGPIDAPERLLEHAGRIRDAAALFEDDPESHRQFLGHLRFRTRLDFEALPPSTSPAYFVSEVLRLLPVPMRFVDCGAYDGDTLRDLLAHYGMPDAVFAFEPDPRNFERLTAYADSLPPGTARTIEAHQDAVGERAERALFDASADMAAALHPRGDRLVAVVRLDDVVPSAGPRLYIKLDVEGAEPQALLGARRLIREAEPLLAVSVYHRPQDLWDIPLYLDSICIGYRFLLRTHGHDGADLICYAVPRWATKRNFTS